MPDLSPFAFGIILFTLAIVFYVATRLVLNAVPRIRATDNGEGFSFTSKEMEQSRTDAVLVIQHGGKVVWINGYARELFHFQVGEALHLERLSKRIRPGEKFYELCGQEGQAKLMLDGRPIDAHSYLVTVSPTSYMVLTLRYPEPETDTGIKSDRVTSSQTLLTFTELTLAMASSLDLHATLQAVLTNIEKLVPADIWEITLWDMETETLIPYRMSGGTGRTLERMNQRYHVGEGYSGYLAKYRTPLLIEDVSKRADVVQAVDRRMLPLRSFLGVPLLVSQEFIGTLELGSLDNDIFQAHDLELIQLISGQAAIAIHNALLYEKEQCRAVEMASLSQISQAFVSVRDPRTVFARLIDSIKNLVSVQLLGFLIYNENTRTLESQAPFIGLPDQFLELYKIPVLPGSDLETTMVNQDVLISDNACEDPNWKRIGLEPMAQGASLRDAILIPMASGGRMLGYLQAANHTNDSTEFAQHEINLLTISANQAATIIENAYLISQSRQRAQRAESLRRIASLTSSSASVDEILKISLKELTTLLQANIAAVFLMKLDRHTLEYHPFSVIGNPAELPERATRLLVEDAQFPFTVTGAQHTFHSGQLSLEDAVIPFYQEIIRTWEIESLIAAPMVIRNEGVGEIWFGSPKAQAFDLADVQVVVTAAGQLAGAVEQAHLFAQTDESLRRRVDQMTALTRITRELSTSLDVRYLLQMVYEEALVTTRADCGTILLFDPAHAEDEQPQVLFYVGDAPVTCSALELQALQTGLAINIANTAESEAFVPAHDHIESALIVPILYRQRPAGLILLHATSPERFDESAVEVAQSLSAQAAVATGNAIQFNEQTRRSEILKRELDTLAELLQVSQLLRPDQPLQQALGAIAEAISEATPFNVVLMSRYNVQNHTLDRFISKGISEEAWHELQSHHPTWKSVQTMIQPEYQYGGVYFISADRQFILPDDVHTLTILDDTGIRTVDTWDPDDSLIAPLYDSNHQPLGLISVDAPRDGRRPDRSTCEALSIFASQAAMVIENQMYLEALHHQISHLEDQSTRMEHAAAAAQKNLPGLLHQQLTGALTIQRLQNQSNQMQASLGMAAEASRHDDIPSVLHAIGSEIITRLNYQAVLIAESTPSGPRLIEAMGKLPGGFNADAQFGQRNPLRQVLQDGQLLLIANLTGENEWSGNTMLNTLGARSLLGLPFEIKSEHKAAILAVGQKSLPAFTPEDVEMYQQLARQVSVNLQNLALLTDTRERLQEMNLLLAFSQKLGSLDLRTIFAALVESLSQVLHTAHAGWAGLWDATTNEIVPQASFGYYNPASIMEIHYAVGMDPAPLPLRVFNEGTPRRAAEVRAAQELPLQADDLMRYKKATGGRLPVSLMATPIRLGDQKMGVLVLENFDTTAAFSEEDEALSLSLAQQTALALESAHLFQAVEERASQLQALTQVAATISSSLQRQDLISSLLDQLKSVVPYQTATLWLREKHTLTIAQASGFSDNERRVGISVDEKESILFQEMIRTGQPLSVPDVRQDERFPSLFEPDYLSWLGVPLIVKGELTGLIAMEKAEENFYTNQHVQAAMTFASQAAVAMDNARLFEESVSRAAELDQRSQRLALLNQFSSELGKSLELQLILRLALQQILSALSGNRAQAIILDDHDRPMLAYEIPAEDHSVFPRSLPAAEIFDRLHQSQGVFTSMDTAADEAFKPLAELMPAGDTPVSALMVPLLMGQHVQGWLILQKDDEYRFSTQELELARTICNQAAIAIQNAQLFEETRQLTAELEKRVEQRTAELRREHQNSQTLLQIITELSASLDMSQVLTRTLNVLNDSLNAEQSMILLSQNDRFHQAGIALAHDPQNRRSPERELTRWVTHNRTPLLVKDISQDARHFPNTDTVKYRSILGLPLIIGEEMMGSLLLLSRETDCFREEQIPLVEAAARQISIALNNAELFNLIRDQAENVGGMLREQQIEASRSRSILEAVADGVLVTNVQNMVTLFNASAERILDVSSAGVMGKPLDIFKSILGQSVDGWFTTIQQWAHDTTGIQNGETYAEQINLKNGKVVSIHLAPVMWRSGLLGTVTIFRDITREVQVDRLKSEFITNVSHELRTPLTAIKGYVDILLMGAGGEINPQQSHFLKVIKSNGERLTVLVNDLLDVSRIQSGRVTLNIGQVDLKEISAQVIQEIRHRSEDESKPMQISVDMPGTVPLVTGDVDRVHQVLRNLVVNSFLYTQENGRITIRLSPTDSTVRVDVIDTGIGIPVEEQKRIFDRFYRGNDPLVLASSGNGMGLAISKVLVEMMGGQIWFQSTGVSGEGSTFSFTLPVSFVKE